ncbi:hypothetical protein QTL91_24510, partial [Salmonella enterica subsp. enterica serovar Typhimurium]|nr:hypothetical protein [Salmonella enterica subsp. enterica serovar Typhimurium]
RYSSDPDYPCQLLSIDSDDVCIGHELLQALKNSRTYTPEESEEYLSLEKRYSSDPDYPCQLLSIDSDDVCIGHELLQALKNS